MAPADWPTCVLMAKHLHDDCIMQSGVGDDLDGVYTSRAQALYEFPADVADHACKRWGRAHKWYPSKAELLDQCREIVADRRALLSAVMLAIEEHENPAPVEDQDPPLTAEQRAARADAMRDLAKSLGSSIKPSRERVRRLAMKERFEANQRPEDQQEGTA